MITMGQSPDGSTYSNTPTNFILVQGNADLVNGWVFPRIWTSQITKKCEVGDFIMSVRAPAGTMGKTAFNAVIGRGVAAIKGKEFVFQSLVRMDLNGYWNKYSTGSTFESLNSDAIKNATIQIPSALEQDKIGLMLINLDNLITLHQRKVDKLLKLKQALLEKMFPLDDEVVPQIRFKGFNNDWEQRKLGEICLSFEYGLNAAAKEFDGENKYLRITDIDESSRCYLTSDMCSPKINLSTKESYLLKEGNIVFARTGASVGKTYLYKKLDGKVYFAGFLIRVKIKTLFSSMFIFQSTLLRQYERFVRITSQRSGQPGINAKEYSEFNLLLPRYEEQIKVGIFFDTLDNLITLHQRNEINVALRGIFYNN